MYSFAEAVAGSSAPREVIDTLALVEVPYCSESGAISRGQLVVHRALVSEVVHIFQAVCENKFPIQSIVPIVAYNWDDEESMVANNSSAFNYRLVAGTSRLSNHSNGRAIDINPVYNPYMRQDGLVLPPGATYDPGRPGTIVRGGILHALFSEHGWEWGGGWPDRKDYHHFQKPL